MNSRSALVCLGMLWLCGCGTQVRIDSEPERARVYIDGSLAGYTPLTVHLSSSDRDVRLESPGYFTTKARLSRRYDPRSWPCLILFPVCLLPAVSTRLEDRYVIPLRSGNGVVDIGVVEGESLKAVK